MSATGDPRIVYQELAARYSEPQRHYHNLRHIAECLGEFDSARPLARNPVALELAIWFHDAVYDPRAPDNEEKSAALAKRRMGEADGDPESCAAVVALVLATKAHDPTPHPDAPLLIDVDLSILGQGKERFRAYESEIRREYEWVPEEMFAARRGAILERFLARARIYTTEPFYCKYEQQARSNLRESIRKLKRRL